MPLQNQSPFMRHCFCEWLCSLFYSVVYFKSSGIIDEHQFYSVIWRTKKIFNRIWRKSQLSVRHHSTRLNWCLENQLLVNYIVLENKSISHPPYNAQVYIYLNMRVPETLHCSERKNKHSVKSYCTTIFLIRPPIGGELCDNLLGFDYATYMYSAATH